MTQKSLRLKAGFNRMRILISPFLGPAATQERHKADKSNKSRGGFWNKCSLKLNFRELHGVGDGLVIHSRENQHVVGIGAIICKFYNLTETSSVRSIIPAIRQAQSTRCNQAKVCQGNGGARKVDVSIAAPELKAGWVALGSIICYPEFNTGND